MNADEYEVFAIRYATREGMRREHFIGADVHDTPMPMDYFVWLVRNAQRTVVVDTGFSREMAGKRRRTYLRSPAEGLTMMGVNAAEVREVVLTHMHYDHVGTFDAFPAARFHLQELEMGYATGRHMCNGYFSHAYEVDEVTAMVRLVYADRVSFHSGTHELAPGLSLHLVGGHTAGLQCVRVKTARGWVVLASDASHYYEQLTSGRCFAVGFHLGDMVDGYRKVTELAETPDHVIPGHDPLVMRNYPAPSPELAGVAVTLHVPPLRE